MSTDCTEAGFSVPFLDEYQETDFLVKFFNVEDEGELDNVFYPPDKEKEWQVTTDYHNRKGLVFRVHNKWDDHYLQFTTKETRMKEAKDSIPEEYRHMVDMREFSVYAIVYYNGSEKPFEF